jgi:hypothetical protein
MINQELKSGDRIKLLYMEDETSIDMGTEGTVVGVAKIFGETQYSVDWDNGSKLSLIKGVDAWVKLKPNTIKESEDDVFLQNIDAFRYFKMKFFKNYLLKLRECGATNMFGASPYLYMGREKMETDFNYHNVDSEICEEVLELADKAKDELIKGTIKFMNENNLEIDVNRVSRYAKKLANSILIVYMHLI